MNYYTSTTQNTIPQTKPNTNISKEQFNEMMQGIETVWTQWNQQLDKANKDYVTLEDMIQTYGVQSQPSPILHNIQQQKYQLQYKLVQLHQLLWNVRHQITTKLINDELPQKGIDTITQ